MSWGEVHCALASLKGQRSARRSSAQGSLARAWMPFQFSAEADLYKEHFDAACKEGKK